MLAGALGMGGVASDLWATCGPWESTGWCSERPSLNPCMPFIGRVTELIISHLFLICKVDSHICFPR